MCYRHIYEERRVTMRLKTRKPDCPVKPPDLAQRVRSLMAQTNEFTPGRGTGVTQSMIFLSSPDNPSANGSFEDLDIPYIDEDEDLP
ncbi:unnamed protein product [Pleuronectes platessa]|uniref:Uncharacterized protein n=1 Tax=Pleuronectes platessa TaxID=8262 RepID=A0A9N7TRF8_PLEPL|nr:unnamed protein product [Pleuronectes platessa]